MAEAQRKFLPGYNYYVPGMQAAGALGQALKDRVYFGAPIVAAADNILNDQSIAAAVDTTTFVAAFLNTEAQMGRYGRNLTVVASGAATSNVTVHGRDYLGQAMRESFTLNGTTPVVGVKAFRYVDRVVAGITAATTFDLGLGARFGVPYMCTKCNAEWADEVVAAAGTLTAGVLTDPQTATTADPRGLYTPTTTPNGSKQLVAEFEYSNYVNAAGNGGLHGIKHYNG